MVIAATTTNWPGSMVPLRAGLSARARYWKTSGIRVELFANSDTNELILIQIG